VNVDAGQDYLPRMTAAYWAHIGSFVRAAVVDAAPQTAYSERELYAAATPLTLWAWQTAAMPLERDVIFAVRTIERFTAVGLTHYGSKAGRNTLRSRLLRISEALLGAPVMPPVLRALGGSDPSAPYSAREVVTLKSWALTQSTAQRRSNAEALLALGLGAGLAGREIVKLAVGDIQADDDGVLILVRGDRARSVPVLREWERALTELVSTRLAETWAFREQHAAVNRNLITDFVSHSEGKIRLQARRMHSTWIVQHLEAGTPLVPLMRAAGLQSPEALDRFLRFAREPDPLHCRNALRDALAAPR
jgi:integrase